ncbi:MAG: ABC transporter permease [Candidatus Micrarchaeia archaeon]
MHESVSRIYSQVYKSTRTLRRNPFRLADVFIWPMIFLFTLTFFAKYVGSEQTYINVIILGMMGWRMIYFPNLEMVSSFIEEHWSKSLAHLIISPITRLEFAIGAAISGFAKATFVILIYVLATNLLYGFTISDLPVFILAIFFFALIGFSMGLFTLGFAYFNKEEAFNVAFIWPDVIVLLSGVYFSIETVYPSQILPLIRLLPSTQAFELLKSTVGLGHPDIGLLVATTVIWLAAGYLFSGYMYGKAKREGKLARLG